MIIIDQIKGHEPIKFQLQQALTKDRLPHALLFSGPSGIGKKKMAWALAQNLLCQEGNSCGKCYNCLSVSKEHNESVLCITHETLQIRLQDVKAIPPFLSLQSFSKAKIVLIDSAEKLNLQAANFLLKIIEEPPPKSFFFFISSRPSKLPITIRSRIQNLRFQSLPKSVIKEIVPKETADWIINGSQGRLDLIEELKSLKEIRELSFSLWSKISTTPFSDLELPKLINNRKEALIICSFWQQILRDARFFQLQTSKDLIHGDKMEEIEKLCQIPYRVLDSWIKKTLEMEADLHTNVNYVLCFENFVIAIQKILKTLKEE